ncbi:hypothetical protein GQ53DRAFT_879396 [Thozetella sp. PMI_491]|nr:hypothetical protein GQ53DRAFT_879396 [Thozetella sp. PMI_491]
MFTLLLLAAVPLAVAASHWSHQAPFTNLVTFGDSYTDNGRLGYYFGHNGTGPPPGVYQTVTNKTASGGLAWGQFVEQYARVNYFDYAVSGATCSNALVSRWLAGIGRSFPSVMDDEIPSFQADVSFKALYPDRTPENTVYALWIGTNDLGFTGAMLSDSQTPGATITDFVSCVWTVFDSIYKTGGRRFVLLNEAPLQLSPLYASISQGGDSNDQFWPNKTLYNTTEYSEKIRQYTTSVNTMFDYGVPFNLVVKSRWPRATFSIFDVHSLMTDIYNNPKQYLDAPYNVKGSYHTCDPSGSTCVDHSDLGPLSGFLWYDSLHPSEKTDSIIAKHFLDVVAGNSTYGTTYKG